uniref:Armadillo repeat-containing protein 8 n=1 Tax=Kalanchoe fedtschenkoi TaxID=63787 RepID=A0A7N0SWY3_KALFE
MQKSVFIEFGGLNLLIELSKSMDSEVRVKAVKALRNMMFHADKKLKEEILSDLTIPFIECLIQDAETFVQEQALAMVRNLVDGSISNIDFVFAEDSVMLNAVCKQLQNAEVVEVQIQGMCVLCNVAIGNELHKDAVSHKVAPEASSGNDSITIKSLQSTDNRLRTATIWTIINLTLPSTPGAHRRVERLRNAGIIAQIKTMVNDPCLDVKLRVRTVIEYSATVGEGSVTL